MKTCVMIFLIVGVNLAYDMTPFDSLHSDTSCSMVVTTDNGDVVPVWLDRSRVGNTPLCIKGLSRGIHDISFISPNTRDSILNGNVDMVGDGQHILSYATGELARESNKHVYHELGKTDHVLFQIGAAQAESARLKKRGHTKMVWTIIGFGTAICLFVLSLIVRNYV